MEKKLLKPSDIAEMLGVKIRTVYHWIHTKQIPHIKLGKKLVRFDQEEIKKWVETFRKKYN